MEPIGLLAGLILIDFICSLFAYSLGSVSRFKLEEYIVALRKADSENGRGYERMKEKMFLFLEDVHTKELAFLLTAYLIDLGFVLAMVISYMYPAAQKTASPAVTGAAVFGSYFVGVYLFCRVFAFNIADERAESIVFNNFRSLKAFSILLFPLGWAAERLDSVSRKIAGMGRSEQGLEEEVEDEIKESITEGVEDGVLEEDEKKMIESVLKFNDADVKEIMTPRTDIVSILTSSSLQEGIRLAMESGFSRIPAYEKNIDDIKGVMYVKDILQYADKEESKTMDVVEIIRDAYFIPESKMISELFDEIREKKNHFAVVLDEYGGTSGIVTVEDIVEEIVGEIEDEYDAQPKDKITWLSETAAEVDARIDIEELNEAMNISLPDEEDFESLGGFLTYKMGKIPEVNETVAYDNVNFRIMRGTKRRILWVEVKKESG
ncbi:hemolysin family protein [Planctomycetota bacterium]